MEENLEKLKIFIENDSLIKRKLIEISPKEKDEYDENSKIDYYEKLFKEFKNIEDAFSILLNLFSTNNEIGRIRQVAESKLKEIKTRVMNSCYSFKELKQIYSNFFSAMSPKILGETKKACIGYYIWRETKVTELMQNVQTINELLHVIHSYIFNNEHILQSMPIVASKENQCEKYVLYGEENEVSRQIYEKINPETTKLGTTFIVSLPNKVLMMVRDSGHALTLDIDIDGDKICTKYFIPKICNVELVNKLKGVNKVRKNDTATYGTFESSKGDIGNEIIDFIEKVPTDSDIPFIQNEIVSTDSDTSISIAEDNTDVVDEPTVEKQEKEIDLLNQDEEKWITKLREFAFKTEHLPKKLKMQFLIAKKNILEFFGKIAKTNPKTKEKIQNDKNER